VTLPLPSELGDELLVQLSLLKGRIITASVTVESGPLEFDEPFLNELHQRLVECATAVDIVITQVEEQQFSQRYWFQQLGDSAVVDIYYNKKKQFTSCDPKNSLTTSKALSNQVLTLISEGLG
jgi:hypothetical protein